MKPKPMAHNAPASKGGVGHIGTATGEAGERKGVHGERTRSGNRAYTV